MNDLKCPRCGSAMELGIVMDRAHYSDPQIPNWVEGIPERSFWTGLKLKGRETHPVRSYRGEKCGYLESYALLAEAK